MSTNNERNGGDTPSHGGDITSTKGKTTPLKEPGIDAHFEKSGGGEDGGDIFPYLVSDCYKQTDANLDCVINYS
jgi:hypothetical protein